MHPVRGRSVPLGIKNVWVDVEASVLRVVVADEDPEEDSDGTGEPTAQQKKDIKIC